MLSCWLHGVMSDSPGLHTPGNWLPGVWDPGELDLPGYATPGRFDETLVSMTPRGMIPRGDWLPEVPEVSYPAPVNLTHRGTTYPGESCFLRIFYWLDEKYGGRKSLWTVFLNRHSNEILDLRFCHHSNLIELLTNKLKIYILGKMLVSYSNFKFKKDPRPREID